MKRLHVHVAVDDLAASIHFYSALFAVEPTVAKDDYAKWMLDDPRVNFAISARGAAPGLNHLAYSRKLRGTRRDEGTPAKARRRGGRGDGHRLLLRQIGQVLATDPPHRVETYHTLDSIPVFGGPSAGGCCVPSLPCQSFRLHPG